jgi:membrane associated rhomboid family serine protease/predicted RNA-binding Zn-ribbon protein involved in translation (DUF1610 family)
MIRCPSCSRPLVRALTPFGVVQHCPECGGRMIGLSTLRRDQVSGEFRGRLWHDSAHARTGDRACPHCGQRMRQVDVPAGPGRVELDVCRHCQTVWFDRAEYGQVPHNAAEPAAPGQGSSLPVADLRAREAAAMMRLRSLQERAETAEEGRPLALWKYLPAALGTPVEVSAPQLAVRPLATWGLSAALVAVFLATMGNLETAVQALGFVPSHWARAGGLTAVTSFFIHGGWLHLLSNLYFLLVFGDNVEDRLGRFRFLLLVLFSHLAGTALHAGLDPHKTIPLVGASAGISGVVAYYALAFPRARLGLLLFYFLWVPLPAWTMLLLFTMMQLLGAAAQIGGFSSVSNLGHLGGLGVGLAAAVLTHAWRGGGRADPTGRGYRRNERD